MSNTGYPFYKAWKANGVQPAAGYLLYTYVSGSTVPKITYQDSEFNASNTNPIVLNANGEATIFLADGPYRFDLKTPAGALVSSFDPIENPTGGGTVSFAAPSAPIGLTMVPGVATTAMRSDAAPALSQAITPTWSALHTFTLAPLVSAFAGVGSRMVVADAVGQLSVAAIPTVPVGANPTGTIGLVAVNGAASTFLRSDGAPALSQAIAPTWSALHTFTLAPVVSAFAGGGTQMVTASNTGALGVAAIPTAPVGANPTGTIGLAVVNGAAATFLRSDGAPALSQAITPTWSALHTFTLAPVISALAGGGTQMVTVSNTGVLGVGSLPGSGANPTGTVGLTTVNGAASTFLRSDSAPALSQSIVPTWSGIHTFTAKILLNSATPNIAWNETDAAVDNRYWDILANGTQLLFRTVNDAGTVANNFMYITRSGTSVNTVTIAANLALTSDLSCNIASVSGKVLLNANTPNLAWNELDAAANNRYWDIIASAEQLQFRVVNDAGSSANSYMLVDRTGIVIDSVTFPRPVILSNLAGTGSRLVQASSTGALTATQLATNLPHILNTNTTAIGNVLTGEDDLMTYSVPAATLATDGDSLNITAAGTFALATVRLRAYFGSDLLFDTGNLVLGAAADWGIECDIVRTGATTQKAILRFNSSVAALLATCDYTTPGRTLSGANTFKLTGEATLTNDVVQEILKVRYEPAS